jgi:hypothetical protein
MSQTAFYAQMIKNQLEDLERRLGPQNEAHHKITYILQRLWPDLESSMEHELPNVKR